MNTITTAITSSLFTSEEKSAMRNAGFRLNNKRILPDGSTYSEKYTHDQGASIVHISRHVCRKYTLVHTKTRLRNDAASTKYNGSIEDLLNTLFTV